MTCRGGQHERTSRCRILLLRVKGAAVDCSASEAILPLAHRVTEQCANHSRLHAREAIGSPFTGDPTAARPRQLMGQGWLKIRAT